MTTKAAVKGIYTSEMDEIEDCAPVDPERFCIVVCAMVGSNDGEGEDSFNISVCTPMWLAEMCQREGVVVGRHYLVIGSYDPVYIKKVITELIESCEGNSWQEVAEKIGRIGYWEFEDYQDS